MWNIKLTCFCLFNIHLYHRISSLGLFFKAKLPCSLNNSVATLLRGSVKMKLTLLKLGIGSPPGLPKLQSLIVGVKTFTLGCFLYHWKDWSVDVENGFTSAIWTFAAQVMAKRRAGGQTGSLIVDTKGRESTRPWCMQVECDSPLESSRRELQVCFKTHPN